MMMRSMLFFVIHPGRAIVQTHEKQDWPRKFSDESDYNGGPDWKFSLSLVYTRFYDLYISIHVAHTYISKKIEKLKFFGDGPGCFGGYWGVIPSIFTGFSKNFQKLKIRKLKIDQNRFKMC